VASNVTYFELILDSKENNLRRRTPPPARKSTTGDEGPVLTLDIERLKLTGHVGGLFRHDLLTNVISPVDDRERR
jgi:hypothetical protein